MVLPTDEVGKPNRLKSSSSSQPFSLHSQSLSNSQYCSHSNTTSASHGMITTRETDSYNHLNQTNQDDSIANDEHIANMGVETLTSDHSHRSYRVRSAPFSCSRRLVGSDSENTTPVFYDEEAINSAQNFDRLAECFGGVSQLGESISTQPLTNHCDQARASKAVSERPLSSSCTGSMSGDQTESLRSSKDDQNINGLVHNSDRPRGKRNCKSAGRKDLFTNEPDIVSMLSGRGDTSHMGTSSDIDHQIMQNFLEVNDRLNERLAAVLNKNITSSNTQTHQLNSLTSSYVSNSDAEHQRKCKTDEISDCNRIKNNENNHRDVFHTREDLSLDKAFLPGLQTQPGREGFTNPGREGAPLSDHPSDEGLDFDVYNLDTNLQQLNWEMFEQQLQNALEKEQQNLQKNDRDEIRRRLASDTDDLDLLPSFCRSSRRSARPHEGPGVPGGSSLQVCFLNEASAALEAEMDGEEPDVVSKSSSVTLNDYERPMKVSVTQIQCCSSRERSPCDYGSATPSPTATLLASCRMSLSPSCVGEEADFITRHARLQAEARLALAQVRPLARIQLQLEKQARRKSAIAEIIGGDMFEEGRLKRLTLPVLQQMNYGQLQVLVNDLHSQIEGHNVELMQMLQDRDDLHMAQDSMLVDIEDLTRRAKEYESRLKRSRNMSESSQ